MIRPLVISAHLISSMALPLFATTWPDLSIPPKRVETRKHDHAVVVGIENYAFIPDVPGAKQNAVDWYDYLTKSLGVPARNVQLLRDSEATAEAILDASKRAAEDSPPDGNLWFVYIGHGAPDPHEKEGVLVGVDAQQKASNLSRRSVSQKRLVAVLSESKAKSVNLILDACFSGKESSGKELLPGLQPLVVQVAPKGLPPKINYFLAAMSDQFAGPLPALGRPAFSYLLLGALRGWADANKDGTVLAGEAVEYVRGVLRTMLKDRVQTPEFQGEESARFADSGNESGPKLEDIARSDAAASLFAVSELPAIPKVEKPKDFQSQTASGNWDKLDIEKLERYDKVLKIDKDESVAAASKWGAWKRFIAAYPEYQKEGSARMEAWLQYIGEIQAKEAAEKKRRDLMEADWEKLKRLLPLEIVSRSQKEDWARRFRAAYGESPDQNPHAEELEALLRRQD